MNLAKRNAVLAAIAAGLAVPTFLQWQRDADSFVDLARVPLMFDGFSADNVGFIVLQAPKKEPPAPEPNNANAPKVAYDSLTLQRTEKGWMLAGVLGQELAGAPVNKDRVESEVFAHLRAIRADRDVMVQPNATPEQLKEFGLDEAQAFVVRVTDANPQRPTVIADLLVGRDAGQGQTGTEAVRGVFVRKSDSNDVVLYEFDKGWLRNVQRDLWLDKVIAKLEPDKIRKLSITNTATGGTKFTFARPEGKAMWEALEPKGLGAVRQMEVENLVQRLRWIAAQDFRSRVDAVPNLGALGLAPPKIAIDLEIQDGDKTRTLLLSVGNQLEGRNEYYLQSNESAFVMTWPASTVTTFELDVKASLFDPVSPDMKPADDKKDDGRPGEEKKGDDKKDDGKPGEEKKGDDKKSGR